MIYILANYLYLKFIDFKLSNVLYVFFTSLYFIIAKCIKIIVNIIHYN